MGHALERYRIEGSYKDAKALGLGEYRFRESEMALIHVHLVFLACTLLDVLRRSLLRYSTTQSMLSLEATVDWIRRKAMHLFMHKVRHSGGAFRNLLRMIDTN